MPASDNHKSQDWYNGYTAGLVWIYDIIESHAGAFVAKRLLRKIDVKLILNIIDAAIQRREVMAEVGPRNMDLFVSKSRSVSLKEK